MPALVGLVVLLAVGHLLGLTGYIVGGLVALTMLAAIVVPLAYLVIFLRGVRKGWNEDR